MEALRLQQRKCRPVLPSIHLQHLHLQHLLHHPRIRPAPALIITVITIIIAVVDTVVLHMDNIITEMFMDLVGIS